MSWDEGDEGDEGDAGDGGDEGDEGAQTATVTQIPHSPHLEENLAPKSQRGEEVQPGVCSDVQELPGLLVGVSQHICRSFVQPCFTMVGAAG